MASFWALVEFCELGKDFNKCGTREKEEVTVNSFSLVPLLLKQKIELVTWQVIISFSSPNQSFSLKSF